VLPGRDIPAAAEEPASLPQAVAAEVQALGEMVRINHLHHIPINNTPTPL
jgi:hypothetical protein